MAAHPCPKCGKLRKVDIIFDNGGWQQPACSHCGDPGYYQPFEKPEENDNSYEAAGRRYLEMDQYNSEKLEMEKRFGLHILNDETGPSHRKLVRMFVQFSTELATVIPKGRAAAVTLTNLETASMWAHKALAETEEIEEIPAVRDLTDCLGPIATNQRTIPRRIMDQLGTTEWPTYLDSVVNELKDANPHIKNPVVSMVEDEQNFTYKLTVEESPGPKDPDEPS